MCKCVHCVLVRTFYFTFIYVLNIILDIFDEIIFAYIECVHTVVSLLVNGLSASMNIKHIYVHATCTIVHRNIRNRKMTRKQVKFVLNCEREAWHKNAVTSTTSETKISTSIPLPPSPLQPLAVPLISLNQMKLSWRMAESKLLFITKWLIEMNVNWTRTHTKTHINELIMPYDTKNEYQREEREFNTPVK